MRAAMVTPGKMTETPPNPDVFIYGDPLPKFSTSPAFIRVHGVIDFVDMDAWAEESVATALALVGRWRIGPA